MSKITLAVNNAINSMIARARQGLLGSGGMDAKRLSAWCEYGYKADLEFSDFLGAYRRNAVSRGVVDKLAGRCWRTLPWVIEGEEQDNKKQYTAWENTLKPILTPQFWRQFAEADKRRLIGRYAGILLQVRDNKAWDQPVDKSSKILSKMLIAWAGELTPLTYDKDQNSENYGEVITWSYSEKFSNGTVSRAMTVHRDRVFILGDYSSSAIGYLEGIYNNLVNLEKIEGGSGESFLKNAARHLVTEYDKEVDLENIARMYGVSLDELQAKFNETARAINAGLDVMMITQGAKTTSLVSNIPDPTPSYNINLQSISAGADIPTKIIVGMQTGERASSEDEKYMNSRCQSRRVNELSFEAHALVGHLMRIGVIETKAMYTVMWDDLSELTNADKLSNSKLMSEINSAASSTGELIFDAEEIREAAGYDPLTTTAALPDYDAESDPTDQPE